MLDYLVFVSNFKKYYSQLFNDFREEYRLSQMEIDVLLFLHNHPEKNTARDISIMRGIAKSNLSNCIDSLHKRGWIIVLPDRESRRLRRLDMTKEAIEPVQRLAEIQKNGLEVLAKDTTPEEKRTMDSILTRINDTLCDYNNEREK